MRFIGVRFASAILLALFLSPSVALPQPRAVSLTGRVVDADNDRPLRRAMVSVARQGVRARAVLTDEDGRFVIDLSDPSIAIVIIIDVIGAGSAVLGTLKDLYECGADPVAIGALATRGPSATVLARENGLVLETLASFPGEMWKPSECPLCAAGVPLVDESH